MSLEKLREDYNTVVDRGNGTYVAVYPLMFHWTMITGDIENWEFYDDRWCYANETLARAALAEWQARDWEGEPTGWHRHPPTGRRRESGNPATEYIAH